MRLNYKFELIEIMDEIAAVPIGDGSKEFGGMLKLNEAAADIIRILENERTEGEVVEELLNSYDCEKSELTEFVHEFIVELQNKGVIN